MPRAVQPFDPYELLADDRKATLACPGGNVLGFGPGPGLGQCIAWNRIGSLFSSYRPSVARLNVFEATVGAHGFAPAPMFSSKTRWHPNHVYAEYSAGRLRISEDRYATADGLVCRLQLTLDPRARKPYKYVLCFHGQVEQWPFFDHLSAAIAPLVRCAIDPAASGVRLTQPHPHPGLPQDADGQPPCTLQRVAIDRPLASYGFGLSEADLRALWHDHGPLTSLRLRLGQVGARYIPGAPAEFSHRHPLYYFCVQVELQPGETEQVVVTTEFSVSPSPAPSPNLPKPVAITRALGASQRSWQRYLTREVPQLECSDPALTKYWYYVWHLLRANRCSPGAHIKHAWTAPSKYFYWGPWIWDGYFHVLGEMWLADPQVALDSIRAVLDMRFPNGFIPVCSGADYRMCFHDKVDGYTPPDGVGAYCSYVPPVLGGYSAGEHPFEALVVPSETGDESVGSHGRIPDDLIQVGSLKDLTSDSEALQELTSQLRSGMLDVLILQDVGSQDLPQAGLGTLHQLVQSAKRSAKLHLVMADPAAHGRLLDFARGLPRSASRFATHGFQFETLAEAKEAAYWAIPLTYRAPVTSNVELNREDSGWQGFVHNEKTQTPLITVAAQEFLQLRGEQLPGGIKAAARELLAPLWQFEQWLWHRRTDKQGRFILWHGDESGWDDATRHYPVPALPYDVQVHCLRHRHALVLIAQEAGERQIAGKMFMRQRITQKALRTYWHQSDLWYYDRSGSQDGQRAGRMRKQIAASGLFGLLTWPSMSTVDSCLNAIAHPRVFASQFPIPSLAMCDPDYAPHGWGWNGPVWLQVNYFVLTGLLRAARTGRRDALAAAWKLWEQTKALVIRDGNPNSYELYDPETGTGMGAPDYSWQAMLLNLIVEDFAGVPKYGDSHPYFRAPLQPALPPSLDRLALRNLPGLVRQITLERQGKTVRIDVELSGPTLLEINTGGLGDVSTVTAEPNRTNRQPLELSRSGDDWELPEDAKPSKTWRIVVNSY